MIENLRPYTEYKESGLPWLGEVPGNWEIRRMKSMAENVINHTKELNTNDLYLALEHVESWTGKAKPQSGSFLFSGQVKRFRCNDVLFCKLRPYLAKVTRIPAHGVCSGEFFVIRTFENNLSSAYLEYLLRSKNIIDVINGSTFGAKMPRADWQFCGNLSVPLPPPAEQAAIVRFLDWANHRLERAIRAKRKVIALLNEQKQAIIHRAVTRGLDPNVRLKDSGIPWLGEIPEHWEQNALWRICKVRNEKNPGNLPLLSIFLDRGVILYQEGSGQVHPPSLDLSKYQLVQPGDFVLNNQQAWRGSVGVSPHVGIISPAYIVLSLSNCLNTLFANYLFRSKPMVDQFVTASKGVGDIQRQIFWPFLRRVQVPLPTIGEQEEIVTYLKNRTAGLIHSISRLEREITLLREYRTRLISDVVTGKLDVREAAARLPEEVPLETETDTDDTDPGEEEDIPQEDNDL